MPPLQSSCLGESHRLGEETGRWAVQRPTIEQLILFILFTFSGNKICCSHFDSLALLFLLSLDVSQSDFPNPLQLGYISSVRYSGAFPLFKIPYLLPSSSQLFLVLWTHGLCLFSLHNWFSQVNYNWELFYDFPVSGEKLWVHFGEWGVVQKRLDIVMNILVQS